MLLQLSLFSPLFLTAGFCIYLLGLRFPLGGARGLAIHPTTLHNFLGLDFLFHIPLIGFFSLISLGYCQNQDIVKLRIALGLICFGVILLVSAKLYTTLFSSWAVIVFFVVNVLIRFTYFFQSSDPYNYASYTSLKSLGAGLSLAGAIPMVLIPAFLFFALTSKGPKLMVNKHTEMITAIAYAFIFIPVVWKIDLSLSRHFGRWSERSWGLQEVDARRLSKEEAQEFLKISSHNKSEEGVGAEMDRLKKLPVRTSYIPYQDRTELFYLINAQTLIPARAVDIRDPALESVTALKLHYDKASGEYATMPVKLKLPSLGEILGFAP